MEIRKIQGILISSLLVAGLIGCSNSSSYSGNSPWKSKRDAEAAKAPSEEFVEVGLDEAVAVDSMEEMPVAEEAMPEPEMMDSGMARQPELESISDFDPEPVPVESMSAFERLEQDSMPVEAEPEPETGAVVEVFSGRVLNVVDMSNDNAASSDIMSASPSAYAVQVYAGRKLANVNRYISSHGLDNMQIVKTEQDGDVIYVLVSIHANRASAKQALIDLEAKTGSTPWIRSVSGLQGIAAQ